MGVFTSEEEKGPESSVRKIFICLSGKWQLRAILNTPDC